MADTPHIDVAIVGAGIIGICAAFKLQEAGRNAVLIDRKGLRPWGRSFGVNAIAAYAGSAVMVYAFSALGWM